MLIISIWELITIRSSLTVIFRCSKTPISFANEQLKMSTYGKQITFDKLPQKDGKLSHRTSPANVDGIATADLFRQAPSY